MNNIKIPMKPALIMKEKVGSIKNNNKIFSFK